MKEISLDQEYFGLKELVGILPKPLPQTYSSIKNLILKYADIAKPTIRGEGKGRRYIIHRDNLDALLKKLLPK